MPKRCDKRDEDSEMAVRTAFIRLRLNAERTHSVSSRSSFRTAAFAGHLSGEAGQPPTRSRSRSVSSFRYARKKHSCVMSPTATQSPATAIGPARNLPERLGCRGESVLEIFAAVRAAGVPHGDAFAAFAFDVVADDGGAQQTAAGAGGGAEVVRVVQHGARTAAG
jgi:hypothetical protein